MTDHKADSAEFERWCAETYRSQAYLHTSATSGEWEAWQAGAAAMQARCAAQPADPSMDTVLRNAARRSATIVDRGRLVQPVEPVAWIPVSDRLPTERQEYVNDLLVRNKYGNVDICSYDGYAKYFETGSSNRLGGWPVIEWLPLPLAAQPADRGKVESVACGAPAVGGFCVLPFGHNRGKADVPANHSAATPAAMPSDWPIFSPKAIAIPQSAAVPPGYALVPIKPTPAMIASGAVALVKASHSDIDPTMEEVTAAYHAMIRAAGDKS